MTERWPNPWRDRIVFVPVESLAEAVAGGKVEIRGAVVNHTRDMVLDQWRMLGNRLDAYVFREKDASGQRSCGLRFGSGNSDYLSLHVRHPEVVERLLSEALAENP